MAAQCVARPNEWPSLGATIRCGFSRVDPAWPHPGGRQRARSRKPLCRPAIATAVVLNDAGPARSARAPRPSGGRLHSCHPPPPAAPSLPRCAGHPRFAALRRRGDCGSSIKNIRKKTECSGTRRLRRVSWRDGISPRCLARECACQQGRGPSQPPQDVRPWA